MINNNYIIVFDFETCCLSVEDYAPIELAAVVLDPRTLEFVEGGEFCSLMRPTDWDKVEDQALAINKKTREELEAAPEQKVVWQQFITFCKKYDTQGKFFTRPIAAGHNIHNFDIPIIDNLCRKYGPTEKTGRNALFSIYSIDTIQLMFYWFEGMKRPEKYNLDFMRNYLDMGELSKAHAHSALGDVKDTAIILQKFLRLARLTAPKVKFEGAFGKRNSEVAV